MTEKPNEQMFAMPKPVRDQFIAHLRKFPMDQMEGWVLVLRNLQTVNIQPAPEDGTETA